MLPSCPGCPTRVRCREERRGFSTSSSLYAHAHGTMGTVPQPRARMGQTGQPLFWPSLLALPRSTSTDPLHVRTGAEPWLDRFCEKNQQGKNQQEKISRKKSAKKTGGGVLAVLTCICRSPRSLAPLYGRPLGCWAFAQRLSNRHHAARRGVRRPIDARRASPTAVSGGNISPERPAIRWMLD
jgi:hypothetical protein